MEKENLDFHTRDTIDQMFSNDDWAAQCKEAIFKLIPEEAVAPVDALIDSYAEYRHEEKKREEELEKLGYTKDDCIRIQYGSKD